MHMMTIIIITLMIKTTEVNAYMSFLFLPFSFYIFCFPFFTFKLSRSFGLSESDDYGIWKRGLDVFGYIALSLRFSQFFCTNVMCICYVCTAMSEQPDKKIYIIMSRQTFHNVTITIKHNNNDKNNNSSL